MNTRLILVIAWLVLLGLGALQFAIGLSAATVGG